MEWWACHRLDIQIEIPRHNKAALYQRVCPVWRNNIKHTELLCQAIAVMSATPGYQIKVIPPRNFHIKQVICHWEQGRVPSTVRAKSDSSDSSDCAIEGVSHELAMCRASNQSSSPCVVVMRPSAAKQTQQTRTICIQRRLKSTNKQAAEVNEKTCWQQQQQEDNQGEWIGSGLFQ